MTQLARFAAVAVRPISTQIGLKAAGETGLLFSAGVIGGINLVGFGITASLKTHKITDLVGTGAFVASSAACAWKSGSYSAGGVRPLLLNLAVGLWGTRLASYLFTRVNKTGKDERLDRFFPEKGEGWLDRTRSFFPVDLAGFWTIQAMWAWVVSLPVTLGNFSHLSSSLKPAATSATGGAVVTGMARAGLMGPVGWAFAGLFSLGLVMETVADMQKYRFKNDPSNKGKFCNVGIWSISRHPNYLGELTVWWGIFGMAFPLLRGPSQLALGLASPLFLTSLILFVSGVPLLEEQHDLKYGKDPRYQEYKKNTPLLMPNVLKILS